MSLCEIAADRGPIGLEKGRKKLFTSKLYISEQVQQQSGRYRRYEQNLRLNILDFKGDRPTFAYKFGQQKLHSIYVADQTYNLIDSFGSKQVCLHFAQRYEQQSYNILHYRQIIQPKDELYNFQ